MKTRGYAEVEAALKNVISDRRGSSVIELIAGLRAVPSPQRFAGTARGLLYPWLPRHGSAA
ncbi:hypothetical protein [Saccharopolyspora shandongensis]|uniref:hypothetical protein n=1 Tax=Saccharopolyspora shandongensis TaxID=418495 RepID=UPI003F4CB15E